MEKAWIIALNTFLEIIRDRILYGLIVFAILLIALSIVLGDLSFAEQARITVDFGFAAVQISLVVLAIFVGSTLVSKEIEKQTILTLLARPLRREEFILGKFFGMTLVMIVLTLGLCAVLFGIFEWIGVNWGWNALISVLGILIEAMVLLSVTLFFGVFAKPFTTVIFTVGIFLIGHGINSLKFFSEKSSSEIYKTFVWFIEQVIPNLENYNWRSLVAYGESLSIQKWSLGLLNGLCWCIICLCLSSIIFRRRDFV